MKKFVELLKQEDGATAIEYGLIAALLSVVIIAALTTVGENLEETYDTIGDELQRANDNAGNN